MRRVVVTGLGVVAPNGVGVSAFERALRAGRSGVRAEPAMAERGFRARVAGVPQGVDALAEARFSPRELAAMNSSHRYAALAALEAWEDAGFSRPDPEDERVLWDAGAVLGTGIGGMDTIASRVVPLVEAGRVRRIGSRAIEQVMASGISARVGGLLGLGNRVSTNSSACSTGTEAVVEGLRHVREGRAERMLCGGAEGRSEHIWAGFDSMRVLCAAYNDAPDKASRPMSASAKGFVPAAGAGVLLLESLESARARGARIHAEVAGGAVNSGGQRDGGSMTLPNPGGVRRCIRAALEDARVAPTEVDALNGHLTATGADPAEVEAWADALERAPGTLPWITSTKSMIGHALGAAGAIETVAGALMLRGGFVHPSLNCEDVHPRIAPHAASIAQERVEMPELRVLMKAGFGFGDVNAALVLRRYEG